MSKINIYNGKTIIQKEVSIEHIIPKRLFIKRKHANDITNLALCDRYTNCMRTDFRFGDISYICDQTLLLPNDDDYKLINDSRGNFTGIISRSRRIFYPSFTCHFQNLSLSIISMLNKYPYLYSYMDQIV
ncbi:MAG: hypothetical protein EBV19_08160, partial [Flavobacteriia bacterium]|nr:hypothetical protein [Flavobacteriia bacterium]